MPQLERARPRCTPPSHFHLSFLLFWCHRGFGVTWTAVQLSRPKQMVEALFNRGQISAPLSNLIVTFVGLSACLELCAWLMTHRQVRVLFPVRPARSEDQLPVNASSAPGSAFKKTKMPLLLLFGLIFYLIFKLYFNSRPLFHSCKSELFV